MNRIRFEDILGRLDQALGFCRSLGLDDAVDQGRFSDCRRQVERLIWIIRQAPFDGLPDALRVELKEKNQEYATALIEALEFSEIISYLNTCDPDSIRGKLRKILGGPPMPILEDPSTSNLPRNILFELNLAAKLARGRIRPRLGEHPDLICDILGKQIYIECKRPFAESGAKNQIQKAKSQLLYDLANSPSGSRGVIAISVSRALNPGDKFYAYYDEARAKDVLSLTLQAIAASVEPTLETLKQKKKIIGIIFHAITIALDRSHDLYVLAEQINVHPLAQHGSLDYGTFWELGQALGRLAH